MTKDINKDVFSEGTLLKLGIFAECFREWFPVFIHNLFTKGIFIADFFAGSGRDAKGNLGSPLRLLEEAKGINRIYCNAVLKNNKEVVFAFNEKNKQKEAELEFNVKTFMDQCFKENCNRDKCIYSYLNFSQYDFKDVFYHEALSKILADRDYAKFILLDQYGFSQVDENVFLKLVNSPHTDFIFFISSSFIKRFKEIDYTKRYIDTERIHFSESDPKECHRVIADYFQKLVPEGKEYYIHHFTLKKGPNYWGLIFGTNHTLGMEKFLKVCWKEDIYSGESNFNIDNDEPVGSLFFTGETTNKKTKLKDDIKNKILSREITNNKDGLKYALRNRCLPEVYISAIQELEKDNSVRCFPKFNKQTTSIHKVDIYNIEVLKNDIYKN
ncbi:MAG: three-Cys-motif partner protein TcmP [Spirochaetaceae bacterium]|jgi:three-Cys-motif partner protein|nr:three-Cys-motif partner protein TcmP [Spirochaetaceae bacterium]